MRLLTLCAILLAACGGDDAAVREPVPLAEPSQVIRYPIAAWDARREGDTVLMVHVTEGGDVDSSYVAVPSGQPDLDSAASAGVRRLRFAPAQRGRAPIARWVRLPIRFHRGGGGDAAPPAGTSPS